jgi:hypothetical protein
MDGIAGHLDVPFGARRQYINLLNPSAVRKPLTKTLMNFYDLANFISGLIYAEEP